MQFTGPERADLAAAFQELGIAGSVVDRNSDRWRLISSGRSWEAVKLRRVARQLNFFHGVAGKFNLDCPTGLPLNFKRYDRVAFPNEGRRRAYRGRTRAGDRAVLVGNQSGRADLEDLRCRTMAASLGLDTIDGDFAPTFSPASAELRR